MERETFGIANGDGLGALLYDARGKVCSTAESQGFANDADVVTRVQIEVAGLQKFSVAEMDVQWTGGCLKQEMDAHRRDRRSGLVFDDGAYNRKLAA